MKTVGSIRRAARWMLLGLVSAGGVAQSTEDLLARAGEMFAARHAEEAESLTRQALVLSPKSAAAMYLLGRVLETENKPKESLEWFTRAAAVRMPNGEELRFVALDYVLLDAYPDAVRWLTRSVEMDPHNAEAWYDLGRARMMQHNLREARQALEQAERLKPSQAKVANNLGVVAEGEGQPARAESLYREAIRLQVQDAHPSEQPLLNLGKLLLEQNKSAVALPLLLEAVHDAPEEAKCHEQLARAEEQEGQRPAAIQQLELAVKLQPKSAPLHYQLGQLYRRAGLPEKAKAELALSGSLYGTRSSE